MRVADMPLDKDARRPIDMIPTLDGWIDVAEEMIAVRWSAVAWQVNGELTSRTLHPLPDLLFIIQLIRQYRDQLLKEAGYAVASESRLAACPLSNSEQQLGEFGHHAR